MTLAGTSLDRATWPAYVLAGLCDSPTAVHTPSGDARAAGVLETRCLSCRRRIHSPDDHCRSASWHTHEPTP